MPRLVGLALSNLRVNLETLGNADAFLLAYVRPRYRWEPADLVRRRVWLYPVERWAETSTALGTARRSLRLNHLFLWRRIRAVLNGFRAALVVQADEPRDLDLRAINCFVGSQLTPDYGQERDECVTQVMITVTVH